MPGQPHWGHGHRIMQYLRTLNLSPDREALYKSIMLEEEIDEQVHTPAASLTAVLEAVARWCPSR